MNRMELLFVFVSANKSKGRKETFVLKRSALRMSEVKTHRGQADRPN
ncbi:hypothetical protein [Bacillus cereus]|nr:hypothetical protein [Bacillus cereus]